ncbi:MAG TPA: hypothetical protein VEL74_18930, partial [Thermoanaerobaculia bacterium]|nr:hypothetical protein [Thermoanaerobaculia bacterium]
NYGWRVMEGTSCLGRGSCPASVPGCNSPAYTGPLVEYDHTGGNCSVTGGYVYRGGAIANLQGTYFFGDFCSGTVWTHRRLSGTSSEIRRLEDRVQQLVTFGEDSQGEIYVAALNGAIHRVTGEAAPPPPPPPSSDRVGVYEPATARFHLKDRLITGPADRVVRFGRGNSPWRPLAGDWNGDGTDTIGLYDAPRGLFRLKNTLTGGNADVLLRLRLPAGPNQNAIPVAGDWDGDGRDGVGLFGSATTFYLKDTVDGGDFDAVCGFDLLGRPPAQYLPIAGDWDGDGRDSIGLYRPATGTFLLADGCADQEPELEFQFGSGGRALPLAGDWDGDGRDGIGLYDPRNGAFALKNEPGGGAADVSFRIRPRPRNGAPLAGAW